MMPAPATSVSRQWQPTVGAAVPWRAAALGNVVPGVMKTLGLEERLQQSRVFFLWMEIVGPDIAKHAQPVSLRNGTLTVAVDHPVWLQELSRFHKAQLLQKIQSVIGKKSVRNISFRIG